LLRIETPAELGLENGLLAVGVRDEKVGHDPIIGLRLESHDLPLPLDDQPDGHALHASGRQRRFDLFPQHGRQLEADQPVENTARLLGVDQIQVDSARILDRMQNRVLRNFVKNDPLRIVVSESEHLIQVPRDGLPFAVFIGSEPNRLGLLRELFELGHRLLLVGGYFVVGSEVVGDIDAQSLFRQVPDMAETRLDDIPLAQKLLDRLGFGGRLYDHQIVLHSFFSLFRSPAGLVPATGFPRSPDSPVAEDSL